MNTFLREHQNQFINDEHDDTTFDDTGMCEKNISSPIEIFI